MKTRFVVAFVFVAFGAFAQNWDRAKLDRYFDQLEAHDLAWGSVAIMDQGELVYQRALGFADIRGGDSLRNTTETQFRIGSITKTYTAAMIMHLAALAETRDSSSLSRPLRLMDRLSQYFPEIPRAEEITLRQMLLHRSGLHNFTNDSLFLAIMEEPQSRERMLAIIRDAGNDFAPGERSEYSNSNYVLLGYIAEMVSGKTYAELLEDLISEPLGLNRTKLGGPIRTEANQAYSFAKAIDWQASTESDMSIPGGAGALLSTPAEILQFMRALHQGKFFSQAYVDSMQPGPEQKFGMGLFRFPFYEEQLLGHTGGIDSYRSSAAYHPEQDYGIAMCFNGIVFNPNDIAIAMLSIFRGKDFEIPSFERKLLDENLLQRYAGTYRNPSFPLAIEIRVRDGQLEAQATGQPAFLLKAESDSSFSFDQAGIQLTFPSEEGSMHFSQAGMKLLFTRQ